LSIDLDLLQSVFDNMKGRVTYSFGAKAPDLSMDSHGIAEIDCSGFVRYAIARATQQAVILPDGSSNQHDRCEAQGLHQLAHYSDVAYAAQDPSRLFIAFLDPHPIGHVWLLRADGQGHVMTMESHGGRGVDSRPWNTRVLMHADACYELPVS
jgi:hypothetical protein